MSREDERKSSLEARDVTVITTSGTLATLLLGLTALSTRAKTTFVLPHQAALPLQLALVSFTAAAAAALCANFPLFYKAASIGGLQTRVEDHWADTESDAAQAVALNRLAIVKSAKKSNRFKAWSLIAAMLGETVAIAFLTWAMFEIV